jgi:hypothetical protein
MSKALLIRMMERYHEYFHLAFGLIGFYVYITYYPLNLLSGLLVTILATYFPDIDHIFFSLFYGRNTPYGRHTRSLILSGKFSEYLEYGRQHHKTNVSIISHNLLTPLICLILSIFIPKGFLSLFFFVAIFHYLFDVIEDLLALGRLNPNWLLKFGPKHHQ